MNKALKWANIVTAWENSGNKATEWCKQNKIKLTTFKYWKYKLQRADDISIEFRELGHSSKAAIATELDNPSGLIIKITDVDIEITSNTDMNLLKSVIQTIKSC